MLSGIGPKDHLESKGVRCMHDLPGVGRHLQDHMHVPMSYRVGKSISMQNHSHSNICEGTLFCSTVGERRIPNLQVHCGTIFFHPEGFTPLGEGFTLTPSLIHPQSMGYIELASSDPDERPVIHGNYLNDPRDVETLVEGVKRVRKIGNEMIERLGGDCVEVHPGSAIDSNEEIEAYVKKHAGTMYHPVGTCRMGAEDDPDAVLDPEMRVRGIPGLRIADASAMPEIIGSNTNATCIMLGERCADFVIQSHKK